MSRDYTWEALRHATLRRQFPRVRGRGPAAVVELVRRIGPIQSQVARAPFVSVASRLPGATYAAITAAHESFEVVRGSNIRGTVHTCTAEQHPLLDTITRRTLANLWRNGLELTEVGVDDVRAEMAGFASDSWRTPDELRTHLVAWLSEHESAASVDAAGTTGQGRSMAHAHSAFIRRPSSGAGWDRQTQPVYRVAARVLGERASPWLDDPDGALVALTRQHLAAFGPANRRDIAWWSGEGLRNVDRALDKLAAELTTRPGPDGQTYYDVVDRPAGGDGRPGVRLLPEFDAVLVGYDPRSRDRFIDPEHVPVVWNSANGVLAPLLMVDGKISGSWRLVGTGPERAVEVRPFPGVPVAEGDLVDAVAATETALDFRATDVRVFSAGPRHRWKAEQ